MSTEVLAAIQEHAQATSTELKSLRDANHEHQLELDAVKQAIAGALPDGYQAPAHKSVLSTVVKSQALSDMASGKSKSARIVSNTSLKNLVNDSSAGNSHFDTQAQRYPEIANNPMRRLSLIEVLPVIEVTASSFQYIALDSYENMAAEQLLQGDKKAVQSTDTELLTAPIITIASTQKVSEQLLADHGGMVQFLSSRMTNDVLSKFEDEAINGTGIGNRVAGLSVSATAFTPTALALPDQLNEAAATLNSQGFNASLILLNPITWAGIQSERSTTNGQYVSGSFSQPAAPNIFGIPVVTSAAVGIDEAYCLDASQVLRLERSTVAFEFGLSGIDFESNLRTARCEIRQGLAVLSPASVLKLAIA